MEHLGWPINRNGLVWGAKADIRLRGASDAFSQTADDSRISVNMLPNHEERIMDIQVLGAWGEFLGGIGGLVADYAEANRKR